MLGITALNLLELTLPTAAENVALDEALLLNVSEKDPGTLRIWESPQYAVVIGRASRITDEANVPWCQSQRIPIIRRTSGGASIVMGPGCLMYSLILPESSYPSATSVSTSHEFVLGKMVSAISKVAVNVMVAGTSDLAVQAEKDGEALLKFSGNSMRKSRNAVLYHGTLLYNFDLEVISQSLLSPPRTPDYRQGRNHRQFVTNLGVRRSDLISSILNEWNARRLTATWPRLATAQLVEEKYSTDEWNARR